MKSQYVIQLAEKSHCPICMKTVHLLCTKDGNNRKPWFYICFSCREIAEVGKGEVEYEGTTTYD